MKEIIFLVFFTLSLLINAVESLNTARCSSPLGMANREIRDHQLTSSSHYDAAVHASYARIHDESRGGAWCPRAMVFNEGADYLEIDLLKDHLITKVEVQGRFANGQGQEYAEQYKLQYWRDSIEHWITYRDGHGKELLDGNTNTYLPVATKLRPSFVASKLRFLPYSNHPRTVCMRVEIYGCLYIDGLVSYSMQDGELRGSDKALRDLTYDGNRRGDRLTGGLGQLNDGETGHTNFRIDAQGGERGYEWIGWRNDSRGSRPIDIEFNFDEIRNFSAIHIHTNNLFSKDVEIFSKAKVYFSVGGKFYSRNLSYTTVRDQLFDNSRNISIPLQNYPAKKIKLELYFSHRWILISEVTFDSVKCHCSMVAESGPGFVSEHEDIVQVVPAEGEESSGVLIGCLVTFGILCILIPVVILAIYYKKRILSNPKSESPFMKNNNKRKVSINMNDIHMNNANGSNSNQQAKCKFYGDMLTEDEVSTMYQEPYKGPVNNPGYYTLAPGSSLSDKTREPMLSARDSSDYAIPTLSISHPPSLLDIYKIPPPVPSSKPPPPTSSLLDMTTLTESVPLRMEDKNSPAVIDIRGVVGSALLPMPDSVTLRSEMPVNEIKRSEFQILDLLGESDFGVVHLCALEGSPKRSPEKGSKLHIIKTLKQSASDTNKEEFRNEIRIHSNISDLNIAGLVGIVPFDPLSAIFEYSEYGDLYQFLRFHDSENEVNTLTLSTNASENRPTLSYGALLYIASQIASGMKYLESRNLVHRDLATRNCLVGKKLSVKISDFAVTRSLYLSDYWNIEGRLLLPVRWMPPESILHARFTSKSDVWSFGVTLWEILTLGRERPLEHLSDSAVVEHICRSCQAEDSPPLLSQPDKTCRDVYQMMTSCWRPTERQRPPFWEILMFLQRKNLSYNLDYRE